MKNYKKLLISEALIEHLKKLYGNLNPDDLTKSEFERGRRYGETQVLKKIQSLAKAEEEGV